MGEKELGVWRPDSLEVRLGRALVRVGEHEVEVGLIVELVLLLAVLRLRAIGVALLWGATQKKRGGGEQKMCKPCASGGATQKHRGGGEKKMNTPCAGGGPHNQ